MAEITCSVCRGEGEPFAEVTCKQCLQLQHYCPGCLSHFASLAESTDDPGQFEAALFVRGDSCPACARKAGEDMGVAPGTPTTTPPPERPAGPSPTLDDLYLAILRLEDKIDDLRDRLKP